MSKLGVGKEIVTYCSKCKLELAHIIVAMRDEVTPYKVQCKTCKSTHAFKIKKAATATRKKSTTRKPRVSAEQKIMNLWDEAKSKQTEDAAPYSIRTKFEIGQFIDHPKFGEGVVDKHIDNNKIEVVFQKDIRVLIHNK
ncbi:hypothetical protein [Bacteriovorax sp. DB6_IX]|uniref:hypothetical protein n=1 Tax=Bacteriovorax sp. DB6_IX TaxID=1353530 RepID=UPI00038A13BD|nr:hypothetical protein [Bacteriovorax sp. DB6_IX]EQC44121.1 hypothetical protein M901_0621 [Bacteriovorax sp. DB6_IX]